MSALTMGEARRISVLVVGDYPHLFSPFQTVEKARCQWHFAKSHKEVSELLTHTALDIVFSIYSHQSHAEMMALLAGLRVSMFYILPVEEACWWLPVLRNGENCFGAPAFRSREFCYVLAEIVRSINTDTASTEPLAV